MSKIWGNLFFSLFFLIAFLSHIYLLWAETEKQLLYHTLYFITYGGCGILLWSKAAYRSAWFFLLMLFPWGAHMYYAYRHLTAGNMGTMFWICILVSVMLPLAWWWVSRDLTNPQSEGA